MELELAIGTLQIGLLILEITPTLLKLDESLSNGSTEVFSSLEMDEGPCTNSTEESLLVLAFLLKFISSVKRSHFSVVRFCFLFHRSYIPYPTSMLLKGYQLCSSVY